MFGDILQNVQQHSLECLRTLPGMFGDIPMNVSQHSPEYNISPIPRVPRILFPVPVFLVYTQSKFNRSVHFSNSFLQMLAVIFIPKITDIVALIFLLTTARSFKITVLSLNFRLSETWIETCKTISVCSFQSTKFQSKKSSVELKSHLSKFFCYADWLMRNYSGILANEAYLSKSSVRKDSSPD